MKEHLRKTAAIIDDLATDLGTGTLEVVNALVDQALLKKSEGKAINKHFEKIAGV
jgi:hypothetical protein